ncbi:uncharacterized protein EDB93DRAFT_1164156, partial [Suillus bovinus]|uniref:uncharacterized protein n=1 Tax=Suillus bovinus TaxID=48563 RepID=UPI001B865116
MHQALIIPEVLLEVFTHVNKSSFTRITSARKSLAALAITCKMFHEPAMDLLWAEINHLEPLLGCVTRLHPLIYRSGSTRCKPWMIGVEPLSAHEVHQFLRHSARIRTLKIQSDHHFHLLSGIPAEACVFPRLRSLTLSTKYLDLFLPHTLHQCHLLTANENLQSIAIRCTALEHLRIYASDVYADTRMADELSLLADRIRLCTRLVTLSCLMLDWEAWKHISYLPTLLRMEINHGGVSPSPLGRDIVNLPPFVNITTLSFRELCDIGYIITVMQHSQFPSLKEFDLDVQVIYPEKAEQLFRALSRCTACQTLERISVRAFNDEFQEDTSFSVIPHLLCFTQLRTLDLTLCNFCIYLDSDILLQAMSTWPHIRTLHINSSCLDPFSVSLHGLFTMLGLCPQLHTLQVPINVTTIDIDPDAEPIQHTALRSLEL